MSWAASDNLLGSMIMRTPLPSPTPTDSLNGLYAPVRRQSDYERVNEWYARTQLPTPRTDGLNYVAGVRSNYRGIPPPDYDYEIHSMPISTYRGGSGGIQIYQAADDNENEDDIFGGKIDWPKWVAAGGLLLLLINLIGPPKPQYFGYGGF